MKRAVVFLAPLLFTAARGADSDETPAFDLGEGVRLELVRIPAGEFTSGESHINRSSIGYFAEGERIATPVRISSEFFAGKYLVTVDQFRRFVRETGYLSDAETGKHLWRGLGKGCYTVSGTAWIPKPDASWQNPGFQQDGLHPVTCISWNDADAFCRWLARRTGRAVRLPTEKELEYAQRCGTETRYWWGPRPDSRGKWANVADDGVTGDEDVFFQSQPAMKHWIPKGRTDGYAYTTPVGFFGPNPFGLYDAIGNLWEYTADQGDFHYAMKGGGWMSTPDLYRPSIRIKVEPESRTSTRGMRVLVER